VEGKGKRLVIHRNRLKKCFTEEVYRLKSAESDTTGDNLAPPQEDRQLITLQEPQFIEEIEDPSMESELPELESAENLIVEQEDWLESLLEESDAVEPVPLETILEEPAKRSEEPSTRTKRRRGRPKKTENDVKNQSVPVLETSSGEAPRRSARLVTKTHSDEKI
jgi:hypothetical protein